MSHSAMSTPLIALNSTGPFRQYELTYEDCQMSSISSTFRPRRKGFKYFSTAVCTVAALWVNVAQPRPYSPGSLVETLTMTSLIRLGAVRMVVISVIFKGGKPRTFSGAGCAALARGASGETREAQPAAAPAVSQPKIGRASCRGRG